MRLGVVERRTAPGDRRRDPSREWWGLAVAVVTTAVIGVSLPSGPDRIRPVVSNPTDHRLYIRASTPDEASTTLLAIVEPRSTWLGHPAIDRGPAWVLHVRTLGASAGTVDATRTELLDGSFTVPISVNDDLAAAGVPADVPDSATPPGG